MTRSAERMLKWFRTKSLHTEIVTDDPLATIHINRWLDEKPLEIYAVTRVNPLFDDLDGIHAKPEPDLRKQEEPAEAAGKSVSSSGYGSSGYYITSSECSSRDANKSTVLRDDAVTVLEQNVSIVQSILVAVRAASPHNNKKKHAHKSSGSASSTLSPIPEGKVDYCIPRPVWPPSDDDDSDDVPTHVFVDPIIDDALLIHHTRLAYLPIPGLPIPRVGSKHSQLLKSTISQTVDQCDRDSANLLRELSNTISQALDGVGDARRSSTSSSSTPEEALKRFSFTLSQSDPLIRMARALSNSSASSGSSSGRGVARRLLHKSSADSTASSSKDGEPVSSSSSSSAASSSGFSDCTRTQTTISSSSEATTSGGVGVVHPVASSVSTSACGVDSACSAQCVIGANNVTSAKVNGDYEKLINSKRLLRDAKSTKESFTDGDSLWDIYYGTGVTVGDVRLKSKSDSFYHWSDHPDFTLDIPRAERLLRKIKSAKRTRCWCHSITSLVGLVFFVLSVMAVSMMLTRGKRIFGSL